MTMVSDQFLRRRILVVAASSAHRFARTGLSLAAALLTGAASARRERRLLGRRAQGGGAMGVGWVAATPGDVQGNQPAMVGRIHL